MAIPRSSWWSCKAHVFAISRCQYLATCFSILFLSVSSNSAAIQRSSSSESPWQTWNPKHDKTVDEIRFVYELSRLRRTRQLHFCRAWSRYQEVGEVEYKHWRTAYTHTHTQQCRLAISHHRYHLSASCTYWVKEREGKKAICHVALRLCLHLANDNVAPPVVNTLHCPTLEWHCNPSESESLT